MLVVHLPRRSGAGRGQGAGTVQWSKQWWVNRHWRNQWYPKLDAHRQRWIQGYVKGPDDKPFVPREEQAFTARNLTG